MAVSTRQIIISMALAPVVQKVDSAIHWINHYAVDNAIIDLPTTYQLDSAIQLLNNKGHYWIRVLNNWGLASRGGYLG